MIDLGAGWWAPAKEQKTKNQPTPHNNHTISLKTIRKTKKTKTKTKSNILTTGTTFGNLENIALGKLRTTD